MIKHDWSIHEISTLYHLPLLELILQAGKIHEQYQTPNEIQVCTLLSIKTGGCSEDCAYCPQSVKYHTELQVEPLMQTKEVLEYAQQAKASGSTRFCMGAAWREVRDNKDFDRILEMVKQINELGMEVCCTLGMLSDTQAQKLKEAGLFAYNHNIDTSAEHYEQIIHTRTYEDRLHTLERVRKAGISVCCGGIIGLGETHEDRIAMLRTLANLPTHPESVPINALVRIQGTPLQDNEKIDFLDMVRMIATARILMPQAMVRLSAGRKEMSIAEQILCFAAGANSIFAGDKLLTTPNPSVDEDKLLFELLGIRPRASFKTQKEAPALLHSFEK